MNIIVSGCDGRVAHPSFDDVEFNALFKGMGGKTVPQSMDAATSCHSGFIFGVIIDFLGRTDRYGKALVFAKKEPFMRSACTPVFTQQDQAAVRKNRIAVFASLALFYSNHHPA